MAFSLDNDHLTFFSAHNEKIVLIRSKIAQNLPEALIDLSAQQPDLASPIEKIVMIIIRKMNRHCDCTFSSRLN